MGSADFEAQYDGAASNSLQNNGMWGSDHPGGTHFSLCDGAVRFVSETTERNVLISTATINEGEMYSLP